MEAVVEKLNNTLSHARQSIPITITGRITNDDGIFVEQLEEPIKLDDSANYHVYLNDFTGWSNVPNLTGKNNKFYYMFDKGTGQVPGVVAFPVSTQSVDTYNTFLENVFTKRGHYLTEDSNIDVPVEQRRKIFPVKFTYDLTVMRVIMHVHEKAIAEFKEDCWHRELGFEQKMYSKGVHMAPNLADVVKSLNILIRTNLSLDWVFKGKRTNILYNIINNVPAGMMISEKPSPVKRVILTNKNIDKIVLSFETEDGEFVNFQREEIALTLVIERM